MRHVSIAVIIFFPGTSRHHSHAPMIGAKVKIDSRLSYIIYLTCAVLRMRASVLGKAKEGIRMSACAVRVGSCSSDDCSTVGSTADCQAVRLGVAGS